MCCGWTCARLGERMLGGEILLKGGISDGRDTPEVRCGLQGGAVRLVRETGKPVAQVARDLGVNEGTLGNWVALERRRGMARAASWMRASGPGWRGCAARSPSCGCGVTCSSEAWPSGCRMRWAAGSRGRVHRFPEAGPR